jgi:hypothetical protein
MSSRQQRIANRKNAAQPRNMSTAGRQTVASNALRHGLTSSKVLLPHEDPSAYEALRTGVLQDRAPVTTEEHFLTDQIAQNMWRLQRARRVETAFLTATTELFCESRGIESPSTAPKDSLLDFDVAVSTVMAKQGHELDIFRRYETAIERALYKSIRELDRLQAERRKKEAQSPRPVEQVKVEQPKIEQTTAAASTITPIATPEFGSVSQFPITPTIETHLTQPGRPGI